MDGITTITPTPSQRDTGSSGMKSTSTGTPSAPLSVSDLPLISIDHRQWFVRMLKPLLLRYQGKNCVPHRLNISRARRVGTKPLSWQLALHAKFDCDVVLGLDRRAVQESRVETPLANRAHNRSKQEDRTVQWPDVRHSAVASDGGAHSYDFRRVVTILWPRLVGHNVGNDVTRLQARRFVITHCEASVGRNKHGELRGDAEFRRVGD